MSIFVDSETTKSRPEIDAPVSLPYLVPMGASDQHNAALPRPSANTALDANGVDLTVVREMLSLTPLERLRWNTRTVRLILKLRRGRRS